MSINSTRPGGTSGYITPSGQEVLTNKDIDGGTASNTSRFTVPSDTKSNLDALTRKAGTVVYATDLQKFYIDNGTTLTEVSGSGGLGEKNYVTNPSAATDTTGWSNSGAGSFTRHTSASNLPRANTTGTGFAFTSSTDGEYARWRLSLDAADLSKKLKAVLAFNVNNANFRIEMWKNSASDYTGTYTEFALSTDSSGDSYLPVTTGEYTTTFDADTTVYLELRIVHNGTGTDTLYFSDVVVGPGSVVQGAVVGPTTLYTPDALTNATLVSASYEQLGPNAHIQISWDYTGDAGLTFTPAQILPPGLTVDEDALAGTIRASIGTYIYTDFGTAVYDGALTYRKDTHQFQIGESLTPASSDSASLDITVPIAEWAGSGTVNLGANGAKYYYCTGGTWGTSSTCTTASGQGGVLGGTTTPSGSNFDFTFTPTYPVQVGQTPVLQTSADGIHWTTGTNPLLTVTTESLKYDGTNYIGAGAYLNSSGDIVVTFGKYAHSTSGAWSGTWYWRVVVGDPSQTVGFAEYQPGKSSGLVSANGLKGSTDGSSAPAGYVGEEISDTSSFVQLSDGVVVTLASVTLTPGDWRISGKAEINLTSADATTEHYATLEIGSGTAIDVNESTSTVDMHIGYLSGVHCGAYPSNLHVTATTTYNFKAKYKYQSGTTPTDYSATGVYLTAIRIR